MRAAGYGEIADGIRVAGQAQIAATTAAIRDAHERLGRAKAQMTERCSIRGLVLVTIQEPWGDLTSFRLSLTRQSGQVMWVVGRTELEALDLLADKLNREAWS